jgi:hypothetical protein
VSEPLVGEPVDPVVKKVLIYPVQDHRLVWIAGLILPLDHVDKRWQRRHTI